MKQQHVHKWRLITRDVLLARYGQGEGRVEYVATVGKDALKQRVCKCKAVETYDLVRLLV